MRKRFWACHEKTVNEKTVMRRPCNFWKTQERKKESKTPREKKIRHKQPNGKRNEGQVI